MKRNILFFIAAVSALLLSVSCDRKYEYQELAYATLYKTSYSIAENIGQLKVPVLLNNAPGSDVQVSVNIIPGTAEKDTDYKLISPAGGVLTFSGDTDSLDVVIDITSFEGEFTGGKDFTIEIAALTDGVLNGKHTLAKVAIADLDHPLSPFEGEWQGTVYFASNPPQPLDVTLNLTIDSEDDTYTKMYLTGWEAHPSYGKYAVPVVAEFDSKSSTLSVKPGQAAWDVPGYGFVFYGFDGQNAVPLELKYNPTENTLTQINYYGCYCTSGSSPDDLGWWTLYQPGAVFTKM